MGAMRSLGRMGQRLDVLLRGGADMKTTWTDPSKPGVPMNPEKDGRHWLIRVNGQYPEVWEWASGPDGWCAEYGDKGIGAWCESEGDGQPEEIAKWYHYIGPVLTPDEATALQSRVAKLEGALKDAAASVGEWGAYASQYIQDKLDLPGEVARYIAISEGKNDAALIGGKDE